MKKTVRFIAAMLICVLTLALPAGCNDNSKKGKLGYEVNKDNMFGICAIPNLGYSTSVDPGVTDEIICDLSESMGIKSARVWMHIPYVLERARGSNELKFKPEAVEVFHGYFADLMDAGVQNIVVMSHMYLYPVEFLRPTSAGVIPEPGSDEYMQFMNMYRECYRMMSKEFPEITQWEPNNETDHPSGASVVRQGYVSGNTEGNKAYLYTPEEVAVITADMCYYANLGIKENNEKNLLIMPGLVFESTSASAIFIELLYEQIESGTLPTSYDENSKRVLPADTDSDNYFNVINWHPYANTRPNEKWLQANIDMYDVVIRHGDEGKKLYLTEFGWYDEFNEERQNNIGEWYPEALDQLQEALPYLETVFAFRMFNYMSAGENVKAMEKSFGIFTSPVQETGIQPKPAALALFRYFNGQDADTTPLYKYQKNNA